MVLTNHEEHLIDLILYVLEENERIRTKKEKENEKLMILSYKKDNDLKGFWNNEGYSKKYDCCYRLILELFGVIIRDDEIK